MQDITRVKSKNTKAILLICVLVILLAVAGGLYWYLNVRGEGQSSAKTSNNASVPAQETVLTESEKIDNDIKELETLSNDTSDNDFSDSDISDTNLNI